MPTSNSSDWVPLYQMLNETRIARFLKKQGYRFHHFGSWWEPTRVNRFADASHNWYSIPETMRVIHENSFVMSLSRFAGLHRTDTRWMQFRRSQLMFETIRTLDDERPSFVFAHFLVPHPPFVTHETGRFLDIAEASARSRRDNYIGQLCYANGQILALVDALQSRPGPKPIIILQADEGPWPEKFAGEEVSLLGRDVTSVDWNTAGPEELEEKLAILSAVFLPDRDTQIADDASPVNTFRLILSHYFGVELQLLPNRHFVFESDHGLYDFRELKREAPGPP